MTIPVQITFHGIEASPAIDEYIRKRARKLETFSRRVTYCRVAVEAPQHHQKHGFGYRVRVEMNVPGAALVIAHDRGDPTERRMSMPPSTKHLTAPAASCKTTCVGNAATPRSMKVGRRSMATRAEPFRAQRERNAKCKVRAAAQTVRL
jgi:ribosome-associated translation inhibitor RaiA